MNGNGGLPDMLCPQPIFKIENTNGNGPTARSVSPFSRSPRTIYGEDTWNVASNALNVVIPIGGIGARFQREGYRYPKPLINIVGKPKMNWLIERLSLRPQDTLWIAMNDYVATEFMMAQSLTKSFPKLDIRLIFLHYNTKGATETLYIITQAMPLGMRGRRTVSLDCDTIYFCDVLKSVRELPPGHGACFYFEDRGDNPVFSYIKTDDHTHLITDIAEKRAISKKANTGAYVFPSADILSSWAARILDSKLEPHEDAPVGEYFTSQMIEQMIMIDRVPFRGIEVLEEDFACVGTPPQLHAFLRRIKTGDAKVAPKKQRFCFDLDGTLVGLPQRAGDYSSCPPIWKNIKLVRQLHAHGHHIIIHTARRMRTHNGNVGAIIADVGAITFKALEMYGIPYNEICFGKPWAHVYVDDLAVHANLDTGKEIGWLTEDYGTGEGDVTDAAKAKKAGLVAPRTFNHVQVVGTKIIKSSRSRHILGEMYFYAHVPDDIVDLFPKAHEISVEQETSTFSLLLEKLHGVSYSHLLIGRALTTGRLEALLCALRRIHHASSHTTCDVKIPENVQKMFHERVMVREAGNPNIYANYGEKLRQRYYSFRNDYDALGTGAERTFTILLSRMDDYEREGRGYAADVIHGDPVFSNAILTEPDNRVGLFDVRAQLGEVLTTAGDVCYDLAKVLQSLNGYDHAMLHLTQPEDFTNWKMKWLDGSDKRLLTNLQSDFWNIVGATYGDQVRKQDVIDITASLLFSLIPLHQAELRPVFLEMALGAWWLRVDPSSSQPANLKLVQHSPLSARLLTRTVQGLRFDASTAVVVAALEPPISRLTTTHRVLLLSTAQMLMPAHSGLRTFLALVAVVLIFNVIYFRRLIAFPSRKVPGTAPANAWLTESYDVAGLAACKIPPGLEDRYSAAKVPAAGQVPPDALRHLTGLKDAFGPEKQCFTRQSRLEPYGFERDEDDFWNNFIWEDMIAECNRQNGLPQPKDFNAPEVLMLPDAYLASGGVKSTTATPSTPKTAIVLRAYEGSNYAGDMVPYLRSLIVELSLMSGGQYQVFLFLEIKDEDADIYSDRALYQEKLRDAVPAEFRGISYLWNKRLVREWYPYIERHNVYYQEYQGLQLFATMLRPDFDFFWQFEMDLRAGGPHLNMLEKISRWARNRTREGLADMNSALYLPNIYGDWEEFTDLVRSDQKTPHFSQRVAYTSTLGSGEEADLITLNPIVDIRFTEWHFSDEILNDATPHLPAMVAPVSMTRTSKQLLQLIHDLQVTTGFYIGSEGTPETVSTRYGMKAVYFPHPVYYDGPQSDQQFHKDHNTGFTRGYGKFHNGQNKHLSFWWTSKLSQNIWESLLSEGACLPPSFLHPFKVGDRPNPEGAQQGQQDNPDQPHPPDQPPQPGKPPQPDAPKKPGQPPEWQKQQPGT